MNETRGQLLHAIEEYRKINGNKPFEIIAAMDVNFEFDDVGMGNVIKIGIYEAPFWRSKHIENGSYLLLDKVALDDWRQGKS